eukprot:4427270-Pyramimonas_sp.AAC.1
MTALAGFARRRRAHSGTPLTRLVDSQGAPPKAGLAIAVVRTVYGWAPCQDKVGILRCEGICFICVWAADFSIPYDT